MSVDFGRGGRVRGILTVCHSVGVARQIRRGQAELGRPQRDFSDIFLAGKGDSDRSKYSRSIVQPKFAQVRPILSRCAMIVGTKRFESYSFAMTKASRTVFLLRVSLAGSCPEIWRAVVVPGDYTLAHLHVILQTVMNWLDYHLHEFEINDKTYGRPDYDDEAEGLLDERAVTLKEVLTAPKPFWYAYDFGDGWRLSLAVEKILRHDLKTLYPQCVDGSRSAPPEDVGGIPGYERFLEAIADPSDEEHDEQLEWIGGAFDPEQFDVKYVNTELRKIFRLLD